MNAYEKSFVVKMQRLKGAGINFEELAREALVGKFGGATEVLLRDLSPQALVNPDLFVKELSEIFGRGAMGVCDPIIKYVDMGLYSRGGDSPVLALLRQLGPASAGLAQGVMPLHDQRIKDEDGNYSDDAN